MEYITTESILSDEKMAVSCIVLLPTLQTKVGVVFEVGVGEGLEASVRMEASVRYGERYDEGKMAEFLGQFVGRGVGEMRDMALWADAVGELKGRLIARGRKG